MEGETKTPHSYARESLRPTTSPLIRSTSNLSEWWDTDTTSLIFPRNDLEFSNNDGENVREHILDSAVTELRLHLGTPEAKPLTLECAQNMFAALQTCPQITVLDYWSHYKNPQLREVLDCFVTARVMHNLSYLHLKLNIAEDAEELLSPVSRLITQLQYARNLTWFSLRIDSGFEEDVHAPLLREFLPLSKIQEFRLRSKKLSDKGVSLISDCLTSECPHLTVLHLFGNLITDEGVKFLADALGWSNIIKLDLTSASVTDDGAQLLSESMLQLETLHFRGGEGFGDNGVEHIARRMMQRGSKMKDLKLRGIRSRGIGFNGLEVLSRALTDPLGKYLTKLDLGGNSLGDAAMKNLADALGGEGAAKLTDLNLWSNDITDLGASYIAKALENCLLEKLELDHNRIGVPGAQLILKGLCNRFNGTTMGGSRKFPLETLTGIYLDNIADTASKKNDEILPILRSIVLTGKIPDCPTQIEIETLQAEVKDAKDAKDAAINSVILQQNYNALKLELTNMKSKKTKGSVVKYVATRFALFDLEKRKFVLDQVVKQFPGKFFFLYFCC